MKILVIGGGPGGHVAAAKAADLGADVTIVEKVVLAVPASMLVVYQRKYCFMQQM
ncbi:Pyridine nucleotide-disulphide oxidoreductase [Dethiosulfatibacter aminovorans DSM 17477]|uniref:Pyridine nucleotide-disulphide oxidoreductase n=1 Tax=Dethiosulfatibacter aminovorans DSM 17477 TaxID=1121476 RepID=A0A1M6C0M2_9FIRM|nr:Pyridine nucleotide-disulphide oxidoreductase [Dethiosulfatibacter aminovorans DSM 17477]